MNSPPPLADGSGAPGQGRQRGPRDSALQRRKGVRAKGQRQADADSAWRARAQALHRALLAAVQALDGQGGRILQVAHLVVALEEHDNFRALGYDTAEDYFDEALRPRPGVKLKGFGKTQRSLYRRIAPAFVEAELQGTKLGIEGLAALSVLHEVPALKEIGLLYGLNPQTQVNLGEACHEALAVYHDPTDPGDLERARALLRKRLWIDEHGDRLARAGSEEEEQEQEAAEETAYPTVRTVLGRLDTLQTGMGRLIGMLAANKHELTRAEATALRREFRDLEASKRALWQASVAQGGILDDDDDGPTSA